MSIGGVGVVVMVFGGGGVMVVVGRVVVMVMVSLCDLVVVFVYDFASLYPSRMYAVNVGPIRIEQGRFDLGLGAEPRSGQDSPHCHCE